MGKFLGVIKMVMLKSWRHNWWVKSRRGRIWPWAGKGKMRR